MESFNFIPVYNTLIHSTLVSISPKLSLNNSNLTYTVRAYAQWLASGGCATDFSTKLPLNNNNLTNMY